jgi:hypothetical protein
MIRFHPPRLASICIFLGTQLQFKINLGSQKIKQKPSNWNTAAKGHTHHESVDGFIKQKGQETVANPETNQIS